jgi:hypothetical protein
MVTRWLEIGNRKKIRVMSGKASGEARKVEKYM